MELKPKEQDSDLTSLGRDGGASLTLSWLKIENTVLAPLAWMEISPLISVKAKLDQALCLHLLEPCSPWFSAENWRGNLGLCHCQEGSPGNPCQAAPWGWSLCPHLPLWQAGMSIFSLESHLQWQGSGTSISLSELWIIRRHIGAPTASAAPQIILFHTRENHRNSVMHLCPHLPYPICSFSPHPLPWIPIHLPLGMVPGRGLKFLQFGRFWETHFPSGWCCLWHRQCVGCDSEGQAMVIWKPVKSGSICLCLGKGWNILWLWNFFLSGMQREGDSQLSICLGYR